MSPFEGWALVAPHKSLHNIMTAGSRLFATGGGHAVGSRVGDRGAGRLETKRRATG